MAVQKQRRVQQQQQQQQQQLQKVDNAIAAQNPAPTKTNNKKNNKKPQQNIKMPSNPSATTIAANSAAATAANGGPRVSFNRDVHVKRIGNRPNEILNYELTNLQPPQNVLPQYHHLPTDLNAEDIRKEAALVLEQAERHRSKADNVDNTTFFKAKAKRAAGIDLVPPIDGKFHSLPTRKRKGAAKPVVRSVSDAAAKKSHKRPSIFSIFSRKSDSNLTQVDGPIHAEEVSNSGRRLVRSKSDVGSTQRPKSDERKYKKLLRETKSPPTTLNSSVKQLPPTQLSPIIEQAQKEDYFEEQFNRERRKSDAITEREKHESGLSELLERSRAQAEVDGPLLFGKNPISHGIKEKILTLQAKSNENMHSSQLPAQKLPLTKGVTVNGMVKRLSMERFSPPPTITSPAFSYIRPNEGITYAQLELNDDHQRKSYLRSPTREFRSPLRDYKSPERKSTEPTDFVTSQINMRNSYSPSYNNNNNNNNTSSSNRILLESPARKRDSFSPTATTGPTTIRISSSLSPSPWQQLSPRNLSDEDEGLGIETRKYYDDEPLKAQRSISPTEPPIIPVIRSITPTREYGYERRRNYLSPTRDEPIDDLGYRRARLESRILTRRFGESTTLNRNGYQHVNGNSSPERSRQRYYSAERDYEPRYHKPADNEILNKYSPERSHLDIIAPSAATKKEAVAATKTSRYKHTKYYDDGQGGVKEVYERETRTDADGKPHVSESRHRERLNSGDGKREQLSPEVHNYQDYEPKSLDSQFTSTDQYRSSPENSKRYDLSAERSLPYQQQQQQQRLSSEEHWQSSLKRDKLQQRSFDKGDSGIENDFRKESFNGDITTRWRKRTTFDDMKACDAFLRKERRHTELQHNNGQQQQQRTGTNIHDHFVYRERSIDDGSHFDPHLDKYPVATSTLRRRDQQSQTGQGQDTTLKRNNQKKLGGFEKVKQLFTGGGGGGGQNTANKKEMERHARANSTTSSSTQTPPKDQRNSKDKNNTKENNNNNNNSSSNNNMVKEEEMRSRYREHRANLQHENIRGGEPKANDISTRRRLSTPKASPLLLKRTASDKTRKESPLAKPEKLSWFKSLDRRAKSKSKEKMNVSVNGQNETTSMKRSKKGPAPPIPSKNLRFFGDTDLDSNPPTITKAHTIQKTRPTLASTLNRSQKYSQSAYNLDRINGSPQRHDYRQTLASQSSVGATRHKSTSMQNLEKSGGGNDEVDFRKRRHLTRSRDLDDISESGSETEEQHKRPNGANAGRSLSRERLDRAYRYENENAYRRSNDHQRQLTLTGTNGGGVTSNNMQRRAHHLTGPPKPARSAERRILSSHSRERDRYPAESSGTEGESSLHSQRSIVYLHATTVGAIPQPYHLRRRSISRDDLRSNKSNKIQQQQPQPLEPMTRTVSRSVSMLAPWKPKLISEGYEINYSQEQNKRMATLPRKAHMNGGSGVGGGGSSSTLTRTSKKSDTPTQPARTRRHHELIKDDQSSLRNSSTTSASKSALSADARRRIK